MQTLIDNFFKDSKIELISLDYKWNFENNYKTPDIPPEILSFVLDKKNNSIQKYIFEDKNQHKLFLYFKKDIITLFDSNDIYFFNSDFVFIAKFQNFTILPSAMRHSDDKYIEFDNQHFSYSTGTILNKIKASKTKDIYLNFKEDNIIVHSFDVQNIQFEDNKIKVNLQLEYVKSIFFDLSGIVTHCVFSPWACSLLNLKDSCIPIKNFNSIIQYTSSAIDDYNLITDVKINVIKKSTFNKLLLFIKNVIISRNSLIYDVALKKYKIITNVFDRKNVPILKNYNLLFEHLEKLHQVGLTKQTLNYAVLKTHEVKLIYGIHILQSVEDVIFEKEFIKNLLYIKHQ